MRHIVVVAAALFVLGSSSAFAQEPPPPIGPFVLDFHGTIPRFPSDVQQLADSRGIQLSQLPGTGLGIQAGVHVYVLRLKAVTFGLGAEFAYGKSHKSQDTTSTTTTPLAPVDERFSTFAPQLSLNFGHGRGWSYLSGGLGISNWAIVPEGQENFPADSERLRTLNYGGGARWFVKPHVAFSLDARIYVIDPGTPYIADQPGSPRTNLFIFGAGISIK